MLIVSGHIDIGVAQATLHETDVQAGFQHQGGMKMAQIVEADMRQIIAF